ncbi:MAG: AAA family ATPase [Acutalibacteraceae bacterium]
MKPIKLVISAFGSFCNEETIDFTQLGDKGIFLVTGETGSGKTTIFDAIMYALYGSTSGESGDTKGKGIYRSVRNIRSDYAANDRETYVDLTFRHRGVLYRVYRSPKYDRINRKGNVSQKAPEAELYFSNGSKSVIGTKEVTAKITEILGIEQRDFSQIVMIAQGKFRELLTASNERREEIFRKIFSTEIYERFAWRIKEESDRLRKKCTYEEDAFIKALLEIEVYEQDSSFYNDFMEWQSQKDKEKLYSGEMLLPHLMTMIEQDCVKAAELEKEKAETEELETKLKLQCVDAERMNKNIQALEDCAEERRKLTEQIEKIEHIQKRLTQAAVAEEIRPFYEDYKRATEDIKRAEQDCRQKVEQQKHHANILAQVRQEYDIVPNLEIKIQELGGSIQVLEESRSKYAILTEFQKQLKQMQSDLERNQSVLQQTHTLWEQKKAKQAQLESILTENKDSAVRLNTLQNEKQRCEDSLKHLNELIAEARTVGDKKKEHEKLCEQFKIAETDYTQKRSVYEQAEHLFFSAQAGILADKLEDNQPCPVCGSCHHPKKAIKPVQTATQEQLDSYRTECEESREKYTKLSADCAAAQSEYETRKEKFFEDTAFLVDEENHANLKVIWAKIAEEKKHTEQKIQELKMQIKNETKKTQLYMTAETQSREIGRTIDELAENEKQLMTAVSERIAAIQGKQAEMKTIQSQLTYVSENDLQNELNSKKQEQTKLMQQKETLQKRFSNAQADYQSALDLYKEAESRQSAAKEKQTYTQSIYQAALEKEQWSATDFLERVCTKEQKAQMTQTVADYQRRMAALTEREENLKEQTKGAKFQDLAVLKEQIDKVHKQREIQERCIRSLHLRYERNSRCYNDAQSALKRFKPLQEKYISYKMLNDTVNGTLSGTAKMTFESFVQTFYFDMVLKEANKRFRTMSGGQYELRRREEPISQKGKTGLELDVFDYYTGKGRPVQTLSGGESFMASLSLALGLSDVIQSRKSGIEIDTLFIDEGFGTLDGNVLEQAVHILNDLTAGDKMIGIISHVEGLKGRIDKKIIVKKTPSGSHIAFCGEK